jgi:Phytochelatin synthase.
MVKYHEEDMPNDMIPLAFSKGQKLLEQCVLKKESIIQDFKPQIWKTNCGPASLSLIVNAINSSRVKLSDPNLCGSDYDSVMQKIEKGEKLLLNENDILSHGNAEEFIQSLNVSQDGMTLLQLEQLVELLGYGVNTYFAYNDNLKMDESKRAEFKTMLNEHNNKYVFTNYKEFEDFVTSYINRPITGLIINYDMKKLGLDPFFGHHSPIAAVYSNSILVMDVWPATQPAWVNSKLLYDAMLTIDDDGGMPRGLLHIHELI